MINKKVLITGAASGIGFQLARRFASAGSVVVMVDNNKEQLNKSVRKIAREFAPYTIIYHYMCDVSYPHDVMKLKKYVEDRLENIDILINNAGIAFNRELADTTNKDWRKLLKVNLLGSIYTINEFLSEMKERKSGHIVNVSSGQAFFRLPTWGAYAVSKVALGAMSELLSFELAKYGVNVTTVYPFMVNTPFYNETKGDTFVARMSMKLLPFYSDSPEKVASKIFDAICDKKRVEMVNPINYLGFIMRSLPPVASSITWLVNKFLAK